VKHLLKDNFENYVKGNDFRDGLGEFLGEGIFAADGPVWKFHRKVASRMFTNRLLRESTLIANKHSTRLIEHLKSKCKNSNNNATEIDIQDMFFRLTMDIFTFIAFGEDLESTTRDRPHEFATAFDTVGESGKVKQYVITIYKNISDKLIRVCLLCIRFKDLVRNDSIILFGKLIDSFN